MARRQLLMNWMNQRSTICVFLSVFSGYYYTSPVATTSIWNSFKQFDVIHNNNIKISREI